jgi:CheY-like chemotaxis protein
MTKRNCNKYFVLYCDFITLMDNLLNLNQWVGCRAHQLFLMVVIIHKPIMYSRKVSDPDLRSLENVKKLNILIVDDDDGSRESMKYIIERRGHKVTTLDEGMKCVNRCSENNFDIILMDYHINDLDGELNGIDIIEIIRECFDIDALIYAYTGDNSMCAIEKFKNNNIKGAFIKPIEPSMINEFLTIVEKNIDDRILLSKLSIKRKNFLYFMKKKIDVIKRSDIVSPKE